MTKKYKLTAELKLHLGVKLYRIEATRDIPRYGMAKIAGWLDK